MMDGKVETAGVVYPDRLKHRLISPADPPVAEANRLRRWKPVANRLTEPFNA